MLHSISSNAKTIFPSIIRREYCRSLSHNEDNKIDRRAGDSREKELSKTMHAKPLLTLRKAPEPPLLMTHNTPVLTPLNKSPISTILHNTLQRTTPLPRAPPLRHQPTTLLPTLRSQRLRSRPINKIFIHQQRIILDIAVHACSSQSLRFCCFCGAERGVVTVFDGGPEGGAGDGLGFGAEAVVEGEGVEETHFCGGGGWGLGVGFGEMVMFLGDGFVRRLLVKEMWRTIPIYS